MLFSFTLAFQAFKVNILQRNFFGVSLNFVSGIEPKILQGRDIYNSSTFVCNIIKTIYIQRFNECRRRRKHDIDSPYYLVHGLHTLIYVITHKASKNLHFLMVFM